MYMQTKLYTSQFDHLRHVDAFSVRGSRDSRSALKGKPPEHLRKKFNTKKSVWEEYYADRRKKKGVAADREKK